MFDILPSIFKVSFGVIKLFPIDIQIHYHTYAQKINKIIGSKEVIGDFVDEMLSRHRGDLKRAAKSIRDKIEDLKKQREEYLDKKKKGNPDSKIKWGIFILLFVPTFCYFFQFFLEDYMMQGLIIFSLLVSPSLIVSGWSVYTSDEFRKTMDAYRNEEIRLKNMLIKVFQG